MYQTSTQRSGWIFTPERLAAIREENRARSIDTIKKLREENADCAEANGADDNTPAEGQKSGKLKVISVEDERKLLKYYSTKMQDICRAFGFPAKVLAAALIYLKRAYLAFSALDHDPKDVMLTCIYLAGKIEESYIGVEEFCRVLKQQEATVLRGELMLLEALKFDLIVFGPHRPLQGLLQELGGIEGVAADKLKVAAAKAAGAADVLLLTDAPLIFHPGQLALAALRSGMKSAGLEFASFLERVAQKGGGSVSELSEKLQLIDALGIEGASPVDEKEVKKIDRRLKHCRNPLHDPSSKEFAAAAAAKQQSENLARAKKAAAKRARVAASQAALLGSGAEDQAPEAKRQRTDERLKR